MRIWIVAAVAAGCAMSSGSTEKGADEASCDGRPRTCRAGPLPRCEEPDPGSPRLESTSDLPVPATRWLDMILDGGEWRPADPIDMPHHHATRLELINLADFPGLAAHRGERLRFTIEVTSREIHQVPGRNQWRATIHARIVAVCIPD